MAMDIGFVGLGGMGRPMATNLIRAGHTVRVWNRSPGRVAALVDAGAEAAPDLAAVFASDVVISILADDAAMTSVFLDQNLLGEARATVHVNMGTCSVDFARHASALHHQHDVGYVSAPVFGRTEAAAAGTLNILASGESHLVDHVEPLFAVLGQRTWRLGDDPRHAVIAKIAGNFMIASTIESFAEACALGEANGVAPTDLVPVLTGTLFPGPVHANYGAMVAEHRYEPAGFALPLGLKDVNLALAAGAGAHVPLPFASVLRDAFLDAIAHGDAQKDWAAVAAVARRRASLPRP